MRCSSKIAQFSLSWFKHHFCTHCMCSQQSLCCSSAILLLVMTDEVVHETECADFLSIMDQRQMARQTLLLPQTLRRDRAWPSSLLCFTDTLYEYGDTLMIRYFSKKDMPIWWRRQAAVLSKSSPCTPSFPSLSLSSPSPYSRSNSILPWSSSLFGMDTSPDLLSLVPDKRVRPLAATDGLSWTRVGALLLPVVVTPRRRALSWGPSSSAWVRIGSWLPVPFSG